MSFFFNSFHKCCLWLIKLLIVHSLEHLFGTNIFDLICDSKVMWSYLSKRNILNYYSVARYGTFFASLFLLGRLKLNLALLLDQLRKGLREMNAGGSRSNCCCLSFFGFLRPDLATWGYKNRCFLVALCRLKVRKVNWK